MHWLITVAAGLKGNLRSEVQAQWMRGEVPVIVATISFGMGVDQANVRQVSVSQGYYITLMMLLLLQVCGPLDSAQVRGGVLSRVGACREGRGSILLSDLLFQVVKTMCMHALLSLLSFCRFDRNDLVFLLKKEASRKSKKKGKGHPGSVTVKEATQKSFESLVKYCEEARYNVAVLTTSVRQSVLPCLQL